MGGVVKAYQFITGHYTDEGYIRVYARDENRRRRTFDVVGFEPYFSVREEERVPRDPRIVRVEESPPGIRGERLKKIVVRTPNDVPKLRDYFDPRWEDDIRFVRRFLIDTGIKSGFYAPEGRLIPYDELKPADFSLPPSVCFWDIEMYADERVPDPKHPDQKITCVTLWSTDYPKYVTLLLDDYRGKTKLAEDHIVYHIPSEKELIELTLRYLEKVQPDVLAEWGKLDREYFPPRARRYDLDTSVFKTFCSFDMIPAYNKLYKRGSNRLKDVALDEGLTDTLEPEVNYAELWETDRMRLARRNKRHTYWIVRLNEVKHDLIGFFWNLKNVAGLEDLQETTYHGVLVDTLLLRKYRGKYMLPSKSAVEPGGEKLIGALVKKPPAGLFEDVVVYDFSRYYPNLMIGLLSNIEEDWVKPIVELCIELQEERDKYDEMLKRLEPGTPEFKTVEGMRNAVKYIGEAVIGYFGSRSSRLYDPEIFQMITTTGQEGIKILEYTCDALGFKVLYYDTDGIFVQVPRDSVKELLESLNWAIEDWCKEKGIKRRLPLKIDRIFKRILFTGVKKRYAGWVVWEGGKEVDYIHIKGFEFVRRDSALITRRIQREVFERILKRGGEGVREYLREVVRKIKAGEYSLREIAISKGIRKRFEDYETKPDYVRGALWANRYLKAGIRPGDQVHMLYVKRVPGYPPTDVVCFLDEDVIPEETVVDWEKMIDRAVKRKVEKLLELIGVSWEEIEGKLRRRSLLEVLKG